MQSSLIDTIQLLRSTTRQFRTNLDSGEIIGTIRAKTITNIIEVACSLAELGVIDGRAITVEEQYWFEGSRYVEEEFNSEIWQTIGILYSEMVQQVENQNYFREKR